MGASFIFTIGSRYHKQRTDTTKAWRSVPLYCYTNWADFIQHVPKDCQIVCIEQHKQAHALNTFCHPERAIYVLGAEDYGIPEAQLVGNQVVAINTPMCLNVAVAGSIVMFHRSLYV